MGYWLRHTLTGILVLLFFTISNGQSLTNSYKQPTAFSKFFTPADTLNKKRFNLAITGSSVLYTGFSIGLYNTWYKQYPQTKFHLFDDWNEWSKMDKAGHLYTAYFQGVLTYKGAKWTGISEEKSILLGAIYGSIFQATIEVMDGFSEQWGFSIGDMAANLAGTSAFVLQQKYWGEQRITVKVSSYPKSYSTENILSINGSSTTTLDARADDLYGSGFFESYLKDYNAQTIWASININSFLNKDSKIPDWLNVAVGYGAENMFGGFDNVWQLDNGDTVVLDNSQYPRHQQYYLGLDIDLTRIKVKSPFLKSVLSILNIFKLPLPTIEYNSLGKLKFHVLAK